MQKLNLGLWTCGKARQADWGLAIKHNDEEEGPQRLEKVYKKMKNQKRMNNTLHAYYVEEDSIENLAALQK